LFSLTRLEVNYSLLTGTAYSYCYEGWEAEYGRLPYSSTCLLIQYLIPSAIVALAYTRISQKLDRQTNSVFSSHKKSRQLARRKRTNSLLIVVSLIFFLSWAPINTLNIISDLSGETKVLPLTVFSILQHLRIKYLQNSDTDGSTMLIIFATCHLLAMSSVLSNPIIYGFLNDNFKQSLFSLASHCSRASAQQV
jgi:neuropeptide Y receptor